MYGKHHVKPVVPLSGWAAEVLVRVPGHTSPIAPRDHYSDDVLARLWVEETVAALMSQEIPPTCVAGYIRFGLVDKDPANPIMLVVTSVSVSKSYAWTGERFVWQDERDSV